MTESFYIETVELTEATHTKKPWTTQDGRLINDPPRTYRVGEKGITRIIRKTYCKRLDGKPGVGHYFAVYKRGKSPVDFWAVEV